MLTPLEVVSWFVVVAPLEVAEAAGAPGVGWLLIRRRCHWSRCHSRKLLPVRTDVLRLVSVVDNVLHCVAGEAMVVLGFVVG